MRLPANGVGSLWDSGSPHGLVVLGAVEGAYRNVTVSMPRLEVAVEPTEPAPRNLGMGARLVLRDLANGLEEQRPVPSLEQFPEICPLATGGVTQSAAQLTSGRATMADPMPQGILGSLRRLKWSHTSWHFLRS